MSVLWSFGAGAACVLGCIIASSIAGEADTLMPRRYALPDRLRIIAEHGALPRRTFARKPHREWHTSVDWEMNALIFLIVSALTMIINVARRYADDIAEWVMSPVMCSEFNEWWEKTWTDERKRTYHGRRRYEEVSLRTEWRSRWARYDTQSWPTLATSGNAWDLVPTLSPMSEKALVICTGMTFNVTTRVMPVEHVARNLSENPRLLHSV